MNKRTKRDLGTKNIINLRSYQLADFSNLALKVTKFQHGMMTLLSLSLLSCMTSVQQGISEELKPVTRCLVSVSSIFVHVGSQI